MSNYTRGQEGALWNAGYELTNSSNQRQLIAFLLTTYHFRCCTIASFVALFTRPPNSPHPTYHIHQYGILEFTHLLLTWTQE